MATTAAPTSAPREFHLCLAPTAFESDPQLLPAIVDAGVGHVWLPAFFYGFWPYSMDRLAKVRADLEHAGLQVHAINLALGHPGDSLGDATQAIPLAPPKDRWKYAVSIDGQKTTGTSLHPPAAQENAAALAQLAQHGYSSVFLDDDFRLARTPGIVGGCFCDDHRRQFLQIAGFDDSNWNTLLDSIRQRKLTRELDAWIDFQCDQLSDCFQTIQAGAPRTNLGIMVMVFGSEKAGIRLPDYRGHMMRVGEEHFNDAGFAPAKGKCDELYSVLFHRRFVSPELAFSESTAFPSDQLSAANLAGKLVISTIADVRNTMIMSGITPFPRSHWPALKPIIQQQRQFHAGLAGHTPRGPFKHYWGEESRRISDDRPFSLFLACGVPFEVTDEPAKDGFTFLSPFDARAASEGKLKSPGTTFVDESGLAAGRKIPEDFAALFEFKKEILPQLRDVPIVVEDKPVVCAWYPDARAVLLWNLSEQRQSLTLRLGQRTWPALADPLGACLLRDIA